MILPACPRRALPRPPPGGPAGDEGPLGPFPPEVLALTVLVIEDEAMIGWLLESLLEDMGFASIHIAASAAQAVALAREVTPGLIVSDVNLGTGGDGIEAVRQIAAIGSVAALFVTAHADAETRERIARIGFATPVLAKPVSPGGLRAAIAEVLARPSRH